MSARSRKLSAAEALARDEMADAFPSDDAVVIEIREGVDVAENDEKSRANEPICLACGGDGSRHDGCDHAEVARLHAPSRAASEMVARLQRAAAEHRAASRALRALVTSELSRDRADLTTKKPVEAPAAAASESSAEVPCPHCAERAGEAPVTAPPRATRKRARKGIDQQTLPFLSAPVSPATADSDDTWERTIE